FFVIWRSADASRCGRPRHETISSLHDARRRAILRDQNPPRPALYVHVGGHCDTAGGVVRFGALVAAVPEPSKYVGQHIKTYRTMTTNMICIRRSLQP